MRSLAGRPRRRQNLGYAAGLAAALLAVAVLLLPGNENLHAHGPMNTGHEDLDCDACHEPAPGTQRQQIQANLRYLLGLRATPADFGRADVGKDVCLDCHDRPDDRHPVYRFLEPRFAEARRDLGPQSCLSCHLEHGGGRVTVGDVGFCVACHEDTRLRNDPLDVPHERLIAEDRWETCLGCHDFHGNHVMQTAKRVGQAFPPERIRAYFAGGPSPYGDQLLREARSERNRRRE